MSNPLRILLVEDSEDDATLVIRAIRKGGYDVTFERVQTADAMNKTLQENKWDIIISDYRMPQFDAMQALHILKSTALEIPFIIVSGTIGEETAVTAMKAGAHDYIMKDNLPRLVPAIERELREASNRLMLRQKEEQLILSQKLEGIGRLASGIAHDFNNHLAVIIMSADILLNDTQVPPPLKIEVEEIKTAGERASELTKQLLAFCRKQILQPRVIQLNSIISEMNRMFVRLISQDIKLITHLDPSLQTVKADPAQVQQVVMNLVVNARDAMPEGGNLLIETKNVKFDEPYLDDHISVKPGFYAMISVTDTGIGMDSETMAKVFEPFFTTKGESKGTGLGLATTYGIVKQSSGYISVNSEPGKGSSFKVYFPCVKGEVKEHSLEESPQQLTQRTETILLVEDKDSIRRLVRRILENNGYTVIDASSGANALEKASSYQGTIHMLITDVIMPAMKGQEVAQQISKVRPDIKILYISGYADDTFANNEITEPGPILLSKPFTQEKLIYRVAEILDSRK